MANPVETHKYHIVRQTRVDPLQVTRLRKPWSSPKRLHGIFWDHLRMDIGIPRQLPIFAHLDPSPPRTLRTLVGQASATPLIRNMQRARCVYRVYPCQPKLMQVAISWDIISGSSHPLARWLNNADHACAPDSGGQISTSILTSKLRTWTDLY